MELDVDRDGSAPNARPATDAEPPLQRTVLLPILPRCPDEHCEDDAGAEQGHHGKQDSERNGHGSDCSLSRISANEISQGRPDDAIRGRFTARNGLIWPPGGRPGDRCLEVGQEVDNDCEKSWRSSNLFWNLMRVFVPVRDEHLFVLETPADHRFRILFRPRRHSKSAGLKPPNPAIEVGPEEMRLAGSVERSTGVEELDRVRVTSVRRVVQFSVVAHPGCA